MKNPLLMLAAAGFVLSPVAQVFAAEASQVEEVERIQVTGSRIKGIDMEGAQPLVTIDADDIKSSSANSVSELLREVSQTRGGTGTFSTSASGALSGSSPAGQAAGSLRGLGASSTLTLINGRRVSVSSFAFGSENFVDINAIPLAAIERIEILPTGASALYGADAVAGVINYILKTDYQGLELNLSYGDSEASSDDSKKNFNLVWGKSFENSNLTLFADYYDRNATYLRDREQTAESFFPSKQHAWASYNTLFFDLAKDKVDPNCPDDIRFDDRDDAHPAERFYEYCAYNSNQYRPYEPAFEQWGAGATFNMDFDNGTQWFNELMFSQTQGQGESTSAPLNGIEVPFFDPRDPDSLHPSLTNPDGTLNPIGQAFVDFYEAEFGEIIDDSFQIYGRLPDTRLVENETRSWRFVTGLRGDWGEWAWETALSASRSESEQLGSAGIASRSKLEAALNGALCSDGSICEPGEGFLISPYDAWAARGDGVNDPAAWDLIYEPVPRNGKSSLYSADFSLTGDLFEWRGGTISAAFGGEVRREELEDIPSELAEGTFENGFQPEVIRFGSTRVEADRTTWALFGELQVPLAEGLDMQLAGRYDHYSDFDGVFNPQVGLRYQPFDSLILRGSWASSFRAPSLAQVGADVKLSSAVVECKPELAMGYADCDGASDFSIDTIEFGNDSLEAEEADSYNLGLAYSPTDDITLTLDYWNIEHEQLVSVDPEFTLLQALSNPELLHCDSVPASNPQGVPVRCDENGVPLSPLVVDGDVHLQLQNLGTQKTDGIDLTYRHYFSGLGIDWTLLADVTHVLSFKRQKSASVGEEELAGTYQYPETLATTTLRFDRDQWFGSVTALYTSGYEDNDLDALSDFDLARLGITADREVPSWTKVNLQLGYDVGDHQTLRLTVENLFDREAPVVYGSSQNIDVYNHDILGRYYRASYTYRF
ncbi:TonB-dependent receptor [Ferrimonas balearica DSM 9799]|uniref:TonB-dependent receptor n=1 Tax=Ferrimonas balearica (strain DSM 9799 / CCM 4581 / KCTC 23876 / PAT) TaxID=550540 RepID=E1SWG6_FERBD|nr:TonB-dependent receptor [Ferrimonas balearica]ADN76448.1 TonB-dependent receptor [Ferrimonas balearica DSM 9799]